MDAGAASIGDVGQVPQRAAAIVQVLETVPHLLDDELRAGREAVPAVATGCREARAVGVARGVSRNRSRRVRAVAAPGEQEGRAGVVVTGRRSRPVVVQDVLAPPRGGRRGRTGRLGAGDEGRRPVDRVPEIAQVVILSRVRDPDDLPAAEQALIEDRCLLRGRADEGLVHPNGVLDEQPLPARRLDRLDLRQGGQPGQHLAQPSRGRPRRDPPRVVPAGRGRQDLQTAQCIQRPARRLALGDDDAQVGVLALAGGQTMDVRLDLEMPRQVAHPGDERQRSNGRLRARRKPQPVSVDREVVEDFRAGGLESSSLLGGERAARHGHQILEPPRARLPRHRRCVPVPAGSQLIQPERQAFRRSNRAAGEAYLQSRRSSTLLRIGSRRAGQRRGHQRD